MKVSYTLDIAKRVVITKPEDLKVAVKELSLQSHSNMERLFQVVSAGNNLGGVGRRISRWMNWKTEPQIADYLRTHVALEYTDRLHIPGRVLHLHERNSKGVYHTVELSHTSLFSTVQLTPYMLSDHMPDVYDESISSAIAKLRQELASAEKTTQETTSTTTNTNTTTTTMSNGGGGGENGGSGGAERRQQQSAEANGSNNNDSNSEREPLLSSIAAAASRYG
jgi:hypothetical protein